MTLLFILAVPIAMAIALSASVLGYGLAQQRYRALFEACQMDRAAAQLSIAELHGVATNLTDQVAQHTSRVVGIEQALALAPTLLKIFPRTNSDVGRCGSTSC